MSANNWRQCPRCIARAAARQADKARAAERAYGSISRAAYEALWEEARKVEPVSEHMREDYQLGVYEGGEFGVTYRCECQDCGFTFAFEHAENVELDAGEGDES